MADRPIRVFIVDDDQFQLELMDRSLRYEGFQVATSSSVFGVSNIMRSFDPDVMLIDVHIPALPGDQLLNLVRRSAPAHTKYVLYSSCDEWRLKSLAKDTNADGWISKSADATQVAKKLRDVCGELRKSDPPVRVSRTEPPPRLTRTEPPPRYASEHPPPRHASEHPPPRHASEHSVPRQTPEPPAARPKTEPPPRPKNEPPPG